jgi:hypothetical protein
MRFEDLEFKAGPGLGVQAKCKFLNGYGASIIKGPYTYGGDKGLYELAVLDASGDLCYSTPITDDVLGHLSPDDVTRTLEAIEALALPPVRRPHERD